MHRIAVFDCRVIITIRRHCAGSQEGDPSTCKYMHKLTLLDIISRLQMCSTKQGRPGVHVYGAVRV